MGSKARHKNTGTQAHKHKSYTLRQQAAWMWHASKGMRLQACINAVLGVAMVVADFAFIWFTKMMIDLATGARIAQEAGNAVAMRWTTVALVAVMAMRIALGICTRWTKSMLGVRAQNRLQERLFERMLRCRWQGRDRHHSGDVLNRLEQDVRDVVGVITETVPQTIAVALRLAGAFCFMAMMDWSLALTVVMALPVFILLSRIYVGRMRSYTRAVRSSDSRIQSFLQESVQHRLVVKTLLAVEGVVERLKQMHAVLRSQVRRRTLFATLSGLTINAGFSGVYLITFVWSAYRLQEGTISYGMMLAFVQLVGQIQQPFREMMRFAPVLVQALTAGERMMELEEEPLEEEPSEATGPAATAGWLGTTATQPGHGHSAQMPFGFRATDVSYHYPDNKKHVLEHFNATFEPGKVTAIVGETGAGKTTLVRLMLGLMQPTEGRLVMYGDGCEAECSPLTRPSVVYVPQGNTLLSGTVRDNLLLAKPDATDEEMHRVLRLACADFIPESAEGLETKCGELGTGMSEGQAQRVCIARSLLKEASVLLFDEATSALDEATELRLLQNIASIKHGATIVFITHRPAVLQFCDAVVQV